MWVAWHQWLLRQISRLRFYPLEKLLISPCRKSTSKVFPEPDSNVVSKPDAPNSTDLHRGFAYVEFEDPEDTKDAIDNMDQSELFGKVIKVNPAKPPKNVNEGLGSKTALWEQVSIPLVMWSQ